MRDNASRPSSRLILSTLRHSKTTHVELGRVNAIIRVHECIIVETHRDTRVRFGSEVRRVETIAPKISRSDVTESAVVPDGLKGHSITDA